MRKSVLGLLVAGVAAVLALSACSSSKSSGGSSSSAAGWRLVLGCGVLERGRRQDRRQGRQGRHHPARHQVLGPLAGR